MTVKKTDTRNQYHQQQDNPQSRQLPRYPEYEGNPMY